MDIIQIQTRYNPKEKHKGYERTCEFYDGDGSLHTSCDVYGECIKSPTVYHSSAGGDGDFTMQARGKFLNATNYLEDGTGTRFATLTRKGLGFRWKILGKDAREIARIIDPASRKEAFFRELFSAQPDSYALVSSGDLVATIKKEELLNQPQEKPKNTLGRFLDKVITRTGLTLRLETGHAATFDTRAIFRNTDTMENSLADKPRTHRL